MATSLPKYLRAAMRHARYEILKDDQTYYGEIPECPGAYANAETLAGCRGELAQVLKDWALFRLQRELPLPAIGKRTPALPHAQRSNGILGMLGAAALCLLPSLAAVRAVEPSPSSGETARVRDFIQMVKFAPPTYSLEQQNQQVSALNQFTGQELAVVVPQLLGLLSDNTPLQGGGVRDGPQHCVCHRATWALNMAAGVCLGFHPVRGGRASPNPARYEQQAAQLIEQWRAWWKGAQGKTRQQWLTDRLPQLRQQMQRPLNISLVSASLTIVGLIEDKTAAADVAAFVHRECADLQVGPASSSSQAEVAATALKTLARIGDRSLVPALVESAKKVNRPEVGGNTSLLFQFVSALNALTGLQVSALNKIPYAYDDPKTGKPLIRSQVDAIKDEAFAEWLRAPAARDAPAAQDSPDAGREKEAAQRAQAAALAAELAALQKSLQDLRAKMAAVNEPVLTEQLSDLEKRLIEIEKRIKLRQTGKQ